MKNSWTDGLENRYGTPAHLIQAGPGKNVNAEKQKIHRARVDKGIEIINLGQHTDQREFQ